MAEQRSYTGNFNNRWKFNGKELDEETGLYYYGARFYNPSTSLWLSVDPLAEMMPSFGGYTYNFNNPIRYTDPTGMIPEESGGGGKGETIPTEVTKNQKPGDVFVSSKGGRWIKNENGGYDAGGFENGTLDEIEITANYIPGTTAYDNSTYERKMAVSGMASPVGGAGDIFGFWEVAFTMLFGGSDDPSMAVAATLATKGKVKSTTAAKAFNIAVNISDDARTKLTYASCDKVAKATQKRIGGDIITIGNNTHRLGV